MKIVQLLSGLSLPISNEDQQFIDKYDVANLQRLTEHELWIAQNLVRRGIYKISSDNTTIIKLTND
jgi:hypothetical protein